jgi:hypothetical protein
MRAGLLISYLKSQRPLLGGPIAMHHYIDLEFTKSKKDVPDAAGRRDEFSLKHMRTGMHAMRDRKIELANDQVGRIRQFAHTIDKYLSRPLPL